MKRFHKERRFESFILSLLTICLSVGVYAENASGESYQFERMWPAQQVHFIYGPNSVAVDSSNNVYVLDSNDNSSASGRNRIQKFDSKGTYLTEWGMRGSADGQFNYPTRIAIDSSGNVLIADSGNNRIQKFSSSGTFLTKWGSSGSGDGQFYNPNGIAVDASGNVYVVDSGNSRIQKFDSNGASLAQWGSYGSGDGQFNAPAGIAADASGNIYVAEVMNNRVQKFDSNGVYLAQWGSYGTGHGQFTYPVGVAVDSSCNVYVADLGNNRIQKFDSNGVYLIQWASSPAAGQFREAADVAVDTSGNVYVADADSINGRIQKFDSNGGYLAQWGPILSVDELFPVPADVAADAAGNVYVADAIYNRIQKLDPNGADLMQWGSRGSSDGQFDGPVGVAVNAAGNVYVADFGNNRIQKFDLNGAYLTGWGLGNLGGLGGTFSPTGVAAGASGSVYVVGYDFVYPAHGPPQVAKFDLNGGAGKWGSSGSGDGQFDHPRGVAVDESGNVYVADSGNNRIQKFDPNGGYLAQWGSKGSADGQFKRPCGVTTDLLGNVYVADTENNRIQKFNSNGTFLSKWGFRGTGKGQFNAPKKIAVDASGNVYVVDEGNYRVQKFVPLKFNDIPNLYWAGTHIFKILNAGITAGCGNNNFCPDNPVTRGQMAVFVETALGVKTAPACTGSVFGDVNAQSVGAAFCGFIEDFAAKGITGGCGGGSFCPNDYVTRAQMAVFLTTALGHSPGGCSATVFSDVSAAMSGGEAFCGFVEKFASLGITGGCGGGKYCPDDPVTRAQMAVFLSAGFLQ